MNRPCPTPENVHLVDLALSYRVLNALARIHVRTAADLIECSPDQLLSLRGFGQTCLAACFKAIAPYGLVLKPDPPYLPAKRGPKPTKLFTSDRAKLSISEHVLTKTETLRLERRDFYERRLHEGKGISEIAVELGLSRQRVSAQLHEMGLNFPARQCIVCRTWFYPKQGRTVKCRTTCREKITTEVRSAKMKARWSDPEYIKKQRAAAQSPIRRAKLRLRALERWNNPEFKEMMREKLWSEPARREAQSRRIKALIDRGVLSHSAPHKGKKQPGQSKKNPMLSAKLKERWADPEFRAKLEKARKVQGKDRKRKKFDNPAQLTLELF